MSISFYDSGQKRQYFRPFWRGKHYAELIRKREELTLQLNDLEQKWHRLYKEPPVATVPIYEGPMNTDYFEKAVPCRNTYKIKHPNPCNGITFRSKNELLAAPVITS